MRTSAVSSGFRSLFHRAVFEIGIAVAFVVGIVVAGCGPTTPDVGSPRGVASADAGVEAPRVPPPVANDAAAERPGPLGSGTGGTTGCGPIGSDGGGGSASVADAGGPDAGRQAGVDSAVADARGSDDAPITTGGRGGAGGGNAGVGGRGIGEGGSVGSGGMPGPGGMGGVGTGGGSVGTGGGGVGTGGRIGTGGASGGAAGAGTGVAGAAGSANAAGGAGSGGNNSLAPSPGSGELAIVELLINPTGTDTGREWIEIVNRTGHALSLAGLHVSDAANHAAVDFGGVVSASLLPAGARMVLIQSADSTKNGGVMLGGSTPGGSFGTLVSLNNEADTISICVGPCVTGLLIDRVAWDASLGTGYDGHALVIDDSVRRCPATMPFGDGGSFGTPGVANTVCP